MKQNMTLIDLTNKEVFPNTDYRFSRIRKTEDALILERDFIGENPMHYYLDSKEQEVIVANSIKDIKTYLEENGKPFLWEHVRAVSNNKRAVINSQAFYTATPEILELMTPLQNMSSPNIDFSDMDEIGNYLRRNLDTSIEERIKTIPDEKVGILLSGGLDSITTGYFLTQHKNNIQAFTLKVNEDDPDILKSRVVASQLGIPLTEVRVLRKDNTISLDVQAYDSSRNLPKEYSLGIFSIDGIVKDTLSLAENPKKDNVFCSIAMYLIGKAVKNVGVRTVFCGEGPNEMINDYGFIPQNEGYPDMEVNNTYFRQALTFGLKESDKQLGRGGLAKHALSRMGKIFANYGIRLESPYFNAEIANTLTRVPYSSKDYSTIKPRIAKAILGEEGKKILGSLAGISKEKFQDGSGLSRLFSAYNQEKLVNLFSEEYGVNKEEYVRKS